jgi:hypothetical protein
MYECRWCHTKLERWQGFECDRCFKLRHNLGIERKGWWTQEELDKMMEALKGDIPKADPGADDPLPQFK